MGYKLRKSIYLCLMCLLVGGVVMTLFKFTLGTTVDVKTDARLEGVSGELSQILYYAALAPNSHNTQMWKISLNPTIQQLTVYLDTTRSLPKVDRDNREAYISLGAYTHNLLLAFAAYGYTAKLQINDTADEELVVITYNKLANQPIDERSINLITARHTDRRPYLNASINETQIAQLVNHGEGLYYFGSETAQFAYIKNAINAAHDVQSAKPEPRAELAAWLRFSDAEAILKQDGLPAEQLGFSGLKKVLYYLFVNRQLAEGDTFARQGSATARKQTKNCAGFIVLTGHETRAELIKVGMKLERFWLSAVKDKIAVHPMSAVVEEEFYRADLNQTLATAAPVQMVLRIGYVEDYGTNALIRRNLSDYITIKE